jgi:hypothetical protein
MRLITIKQGEPVKLDNPETFIQLYLLHDYFNAKWLDEPAANTNQLEVETYLSNKLQEFYASFGLTEKEFVDYSIITTKR